MKPIGVGVFLEREGEVERVADWRSSFRSITSEGVIELEGRGVGMVLEGGLVCKGSTTEKEEVKGGSEERSREGRGKRESGSALNSRFSNSSSVGSGGKEGEDRLDISFRWSSRD